MKLAADAAPVALGRIVDAWGVRGWVKVEPFNGAQDSALLHARVWHLSRPALPGRPPLQAQAGVNRARQHGATVIARLDGLEDRDAALALKGAEVGVYRADFPPAGPDEWYWVDLLGCEVFNLKDASLGRVVSVDDHGAHPVLETDTGHLIPFVDAYIVDASPQTGRIQVDWDDDWLR